MFFLLGLLALASAQNTSSPTTSPTTSVPTTSVPSSAPNSAAPSSSAPTQAPTLIPTSSPTLNWESIPLETIRQNLTCGFANKAYRQFEKMTPPLCLVIDDKNYVAFYPNVDDFTLLEVFDSFNATWLDPPTLSTYVRAEVGTTTSYWRTRSKGTGASKVIVPFWTLVIEMTDGIVSALTWDDSCPLCETSDLCVEERNCGVAHSDCGGSVNCNLQIYVGWFGTDADGKYMTSSDKRLSRFRSGSLRGTYDSVLKKANNIATIANPIPTLTGL